MATSKMMIMLESACDLSWADKANMLAPEVTEMCEQFEAADQGATGTQAFIAKLTKLCGET